MIGFSKFRDCSHSPEWMPELFFRLRCALFEAAEIVCHFLVFVFISSGQYEVWWNKIAFSMKELTEWIILFFFQGLFFFFFNVKAHVKQKRSITQSQTEMEHTFGCTSWLSAIDIKCDIQLVRTSDQKRTKPTKTIFFPYLEYCMQFWGRRIQGGERGNNLMSAIYRE